MSSPLSYPEGRSCYNLGCRYGMGNIPLSMDLVQCRNKCGLIFCSTACEASHYDEDKHYIACPYIKDVGRKATATVTFGRREHGGKETASVRKAAEAAEKKNLSYLSFFSVPHGAQLRRFRPGQRVECRVDEGWVPGTVLDIYFCPGPGAPISAYNVQLDNGRFTSAPADTDSFIRRIPNKTVRQSPENMEPTAAVGAGGIALARRCGFFTEAPAGVHGPASGGCTPEDVEAFGLPSVAARFPAFNATMCSECLDGNQGQKLLNCSGCKSAVYCSSECQKKAWPFHKAACKAIKKVRRESQEAGAASSGGSSGGGGRGGGDEAAPTTCVFKKKRAMKVLMGACGMHEQDAEALVHYVVSCAGRASQSNQITSHQFINLPS